MSAKNFLGVVAALAVLAALIATVVFGSPRTVPGQVDGNFWRGIVYDFQTLIAGLFAVAAAWWTVSAMDRTENEAQKRHEQQIAQNSKNEKAAQTRHAELLDLSLRRDRLLIDRAVNPYLEMLYATRDELKLFRQGLDDISRGASSLYDEVERIMESVMSLRSVLRRPALVEASELYDGETAKAFNDAGNSIAQLEAQLRNIVQLKAMTRGSAYREADYSQHVGPVSAAFGPLEADLHHLIVGLAILRDQYLAGDAVL